MILEALAVVAVFAVLVIIGMPVFLCMAAAGTVGLVLLRGADALADVPYFVYLAEGNYLLVAVPLFVLTGTLMHEIGASKHLFDFARDLVGRVPHALGFAVLGSCAIFAAISGSSVATAATIGLVALPALKDAGYAPGDRGAVVAAGGTLGVLIPPSIVMILIGVLTDQSIGRLFIAGILPGIALTLAFAAALAIFVRPAIVGDPVAMKEKLASTRRAFFTLLLPLVIIASIYTGVATATEAAGLAVVFVVLLGLLVYRNLSPRLVLRAVTSALATSTMILMLIAFGDLMTQALTLARVPQTLSTAITEADLAPFVVFTIIIAAYVVLGMVLEATSMVIVTVPILFPVALAIGMDPIAFAVIVVLAMEMGQITPPVGINLFVVSGVGGIRFQDMVRRIPPYFLALLVMCYIVYFFPGLATWLPTTWQ